MKALTAIVRFLGWLGLIAAVSWVAYGINRLVELEAVLNGCTLSATGYSCPQPQDEDTDAEARAL